jgi:RNA polymerase sigma-70 factor (ECF subfamily)
MDLPPKNDVTQLLAAWGEGDESALDRLTPLVYAELHRMARRYMRREREEHTLQTTALVNELYLRLVDADKMRWQNRAHFFAVSAQLMRHILVDFARSRKNQKRGGDAIRIPIEDADVSAGENNVDLVDLDEALNALAEFDNRKAKVIELRFFGGLSIEETAEVLKVSIDTVMRDWRLAKLWLSRELARGEAPK